MVFRFAADSTLPLLMTRHARRRSSIAWFDAQRPVVVAPPTWSPARDASGCPTYAAGRPYRYALEVPQGRRSAPLRAVGAAPSVLDLACRRGAADSAVRCHTPVGILAP